MEYLGLVVNSLDLSFSLPKEKATAVKKMCFSALNCERVSLRTLASILGNFTWAIPSIPFAQSHYRSMQRFYIEQAHRFNRDLNSSCMLSPDARADLEWWVVNLESINGKRFFPSEPDLEIYSDTSLSGWGAFCNGIRTRGPWTTEDSLRHINELELLGALYAIQSFASASSKIAIRLFLDNATAVCYVNNCGGTKSSKLTSVAKSLALFCEERNILVEAVYLAGELNTIADKESRASTDSSDWRLEPSIFNRISCLRLVDIDLFASAWNTQLPYFCSWRPQPGASAVNAFSFNWSTCSGYAFPPFSLIFKCLEKVRRERACLCLVCPVWPSQPWFPILLELSCDVLLLLPSTPDLLTSPQGLPHPLLTNSSLRLAAWTLSGIPSQCKAFRRTWSNFSWPDAALTQTLLTNPPGGTGQIGVWEGVAIPYQIL